MGLWLFLMQAGWCLASSYELSRGDQGAGCGGVARELACEEFHKECEVVGGDSLSENSDSLAEVS